MNANTLPRLLLRNAAENPAAPAFRLKHRGIWQTLTWSDMGALVGDFMLGLVANGIKRGARVAVLGDNRPRLYAALLAAQGLGGAGVPIDPDAEPAEIAPLLRDAGVSAIVVQDQEQFGKLLAAWETLPEPLLIVCETLTGEQQAGVLAFDAVAAAGRRHREGHPCAVQEAIGAGRSEDAALLLSGVAHVSHRRLLAEASAIAAAENVRPGDNAFCYLPMATIGDAVYSLALGLMVGFTCNCPEAPHTVLRDLREIGPDMLLAPPPLWSHLARSIERRAQAATSFKRRVLGRCRKVSMEAERRREAGANLPVALRIADWLADVAVNRPIRDQIGLSRLRWVHVGAGKLDPALLREFRALGVDLRRDESEWGDVAVQPEETAHA